MVINYQMGSGYSFEVVTVRLSALANFIPGLLSRKS